MHKSAKSTQGQCYHQNVRSARRPRARPHARLQDYHIPQDRLGLQRGLIGEMAWLCAQCFRGKLLIHTSNSQMAPHHVHARHLHARPETLVEHHHLPPETSSVSRPKTPQRAALGPQQLFARLQSTPRMIWAQATHRRIPAQMRPMR